MDMRIEELNHVQRLRLVVDYLTRVNCHELLIGAAERALGEARKSLAPPPPLEPVPEKVAGYKSKPHGWWNQEPAQEA